MSQFFYVDDAGNPLLHKLAKIVEMERILAKEKAKHEQLQYEVDALQTGVPSASDPDVSSATKAHVSSAGKIKTKAALKSIDYPTKNTRSATTSTNFQLKPSKFQGTKAEWTREEDRSLLQKIKSNTAIDGTELPNRSKEELISRTNFLFDFVKKMQK